MPAQIDRDNYLLTRFERPVGLDQHSCCGQIDNLAQNFNSTVTNSCLKPGRKSEVRAGCNVEQLRHLLTDELRGIVEEHYSVDTAAYEASDCVDLVGACQHQNRGVSTGGCRLADRPHNLLERSLLHVSTKYYEVERLRLSELNSVFGCRNLDDLELLTVEHRGKFPKGNLANPGNQYQPIFLRHPSGTTFTDSHLHYTRDWRQISLRCIR